MPRFPIIARPGGRLPPTLAALLLGGFAGGPAAAQQAHPSAADDAPQRGGPEAAEAPVTEPAATDRGYLGMMVCELSPRLAAALSLSAQDGGLVIQALDPDGPAAGAGLIETDVILRLDDQALSDIGALARFLSGHRPGDQLVVDYLRFGQLERGTCILGSAPAEPASTGPGMVYQSNLLFQPPASTPPSAPGDAERQVLEHMIRILQEQSTQASAAQIEAALEHLASSGSGVELDFGARTEVTFSDDDGQIIIVEEPGSPAEVKILGSHGDLLWQGAVRRDRPESLDAVPAAHRERLQRALEMSGPSRPEPATPAGPAAATHGERKEPPASALPRAGERP